MTLDQAIVIFVILFIIVVLLRNWLGAGFTFVIAIGILGITRILSPPEILRGFANEQIIVIVLLLLIGEIFRKSTLVDNLFSFFFEKTKNYKRFLLKLILPVSGLSCIVNNTPIVAIMMPYVHSWGKKNNVSASKLLIPLSYAAILGGTATLIGTSTNLVVNGMVSEQNIFPDFKTLNIFDFTPVGLSMVILGGLYLILFSNKLLPDKGDIIEKLSEESREYIVEVKVEKGSKYHNKTIIEAKLRNLKGLFLVEIIRGDQAITAVSPGTVILEGDRLIFAGNTETIADMVEGDPSLKPTQVARFAERSKTEIVEVVVAPNSRLIDKTAKESEFRGRYDASILAIHRNGEKIRGKIGDVKLSAGDLLLLISGEDFKKRVSDSPDLFIFNKARSIEKMPAYKSLLIIGGLLVAILLSSFKLVPLFTSLMILLILLLLTKVASPKELHRSIDYNLILIIALSLALGTAMIKTGIAANVSHVFVSAFKPYGVVSIMFGIFIITNLLAAIITNKAAVAIMFPIAINLALELTVDPRPFALLVAFAGAASFITPIGYQTNLMVYGPGRYNFRNFMKIGLPLTILFMIVTVFVLTLQFNLKIN